MTNIAFPHRKPWFNKTRKLHVLLIFVLFVISVALFLDLIFSGQVISQKGADLFNEYVHTRYFGFEQLKGGNLPLWNPHVFSGTPFMGGFRSALFYPLNLVYLFLPLSVAINLSIVLHLFLSGLFMYIWGIYKGFHPLSCFVSSLLLMFSGPFFLHIYPGHLSNICTMVWVPLIFVSIEGLADKFSLSWVIIGIFAVTMQIFAGHPQYVFYTAVTAGIYSILLMVNHRHSWLLFCGIIIIYFGATGLSAVQLITGILSSTESIRSAGVSYGFASMFSFPPENIMTLFSPLFFGDMKTVQYWGRCYYWEMSLFVSISGLILFLIGIIRSDRRVRYYSMIMIITLLVLSLGSHTPLFKFLYTYIPGFNKFRGISKFIFFLILFLTLQAGAGFDYLVKKNIKKTDLIPPFGLASTLAFLSLICIGSTMDVGFGDLFNRLLIWVESSKESYLLSSLYYNRLFVKNAGIFAYQNLILSSFICFSAGGLLYLSRRNKKFLGFFIILIVAELLFYSIKFRPAFDPSESRLSHIESMDTGEQRILNLAYPNSAMSQKCYDIWGVDPGVSKRYAEFMAYSQGLDPGEASQYIPFSKYSNLYRMVRCRYVVIKNDGRLRILDYEKTLPRMILIDTYRVIEDRDTLFKQLSDQSFDPCKTVILESVPSIEPVKSQISGTVIYKDISTDQVVITADISSPCILLITDAYSKGWQAKALNESSRYEYKIMPANYILRAIPLAKGHHEILLEYSPAAFRWGKWISIFSWVLYLTTIVCYLKNRKSYSG